MLKYFEGTIFNSPAQSYVNTVNCIGVMGAGIALEFMLRYPELFEDYVSKCKEKRIVTGRVDYYQGIDGQIIVNFPTKWHFKYPSKLIWIEDGLKDFVATYKQHGIKSIAFPKLGCGKGGLDWHVVKPLMEKYLSDLDIDVYICIDNVKFAEGKEKEMLESFNSMSIETLVGAVKLNKKQIELLEQTRPYTRFFEISNTPSIGIKTYCELFRYFYSDSSTLSQENQQLNFFNDN